MIRRFTKSCIPTKIPYLIPPNAAESIACDAYVCVPTAQVDEECLALMVADAPPVECAGFFVVTSKSGSKKAVHVVSAFASELQLVFGQRATDETSNEEFEKVDDIV